MNLEGRHPKDTGCKADGEWVISMMPGIGNFNIGKEICFAECPLCKENLVDVTNAYFDRCRFKIEGSKIDRSKVSLQGSTKDGHAATFKN